MGRIDPAQGKGLSQRVGLAGQTDARAPGKAMGRVGLQHLLIAAIGTLPVAAGQGQPRPFHPTAQKARILLGQPDKLCLGAVLLPRPFEKLNKAQARQGVLGPRRTAGLGPCDRACCIAPAHGKIDQTAVQPWRIGHLGEQVQKRRLGPPVRPHDQKATRPERSRPRAVHLLRPRCIRRGDHLGMPPQLGQTGELLFKENRPVGMQRSGRTGKLNRLAALGLSVADDLRVKNGGVSWGLGNRHIEGGKRLVMLFQRIQGTTQFHQGLCINVWIFLFDLTQIHDRAVKIAEASPGEASVAQKPQIVRMLRQTYRSKGTKAGEILPFDGMRHCCLASGFIRRENCQHLIEECIGQVVLSHLRQLRGHFDAKCCFLLGTQWLFDQLFSSGKAISGHVTHGHKPHKLEAKTRH